MRNGAYRKGSLEIRERHNERKNQGYANADIDPARAALNVHFKTCEGSYIKVLDSMIESGAISTRGLKQDAKMVDEMVFDVNSAYFEKGGGYEYAKQFFEEAYLDTMDLIAVPTRSSDAWETSFIVAIMPINLSMLTPA